MLKKIPFDREKYLSILKTEGLPAALTALHKDQERFEFETFEGTEGFQREMWDDLEAVRSFSRELWTRAAEFDAEARRRENR